MSQEPIQKPTHLLTPPPPKSSPRVAILMLIFCCVWWGLSFPVMQLASSVFERAAGAAGPTAQAGLRATFLGWRFLAATLIYLLLTHRQQHHYRRPDYIGGLAIGAFFGLGMFLQILGLKYTRPSVSAFLTSLPVIFAPLAQLVMLRRRVAQHIWLAAAIAMAGIILLSWPNPNALASATLAETPPFPYLGEILTILGSAVFTAQIICVDHFAPSANVARMTTIMLAATSVITLLGGLFLAGPSVYHPASLQNIAAQRDLWWTMPTLVILCTLVSLHFMNHYQPLISPATAAVVYCLEPAFATAFSLAFRTETLTRLTILGGSTVLAAVFLVSRPPRPQTK